MLKPFETCQKLSGSRKKTSQVCETDLVSQFLTLWVRMVRIIRLIKVARVVRIDRVVWVVRVDGQGGQLEVVTHFAEPAILLRGGGKSSCLLELPSIKFQ